MLLILDKKFWNKLEYCVTIWKPIAETLDKSQPDVANTGQFYWNFKNLVSKFSARGRNESLPSWDRGLAKEIIKCLRQAWNNFLKSKIFEACAIIDPRFTDKIDSMNSRDKSDGLKLLKQQSIALAREYNINWRKFLNKDRDKDDREQSNDSDIKEDAFATFKFEFEVDKSLFDFDFNYIANDGKNDKNNKNNNNNNENSNENESDSNVISDDSNGNQNDSNNNNNNNNDNENRNKTTKTNKNHINVKV